MNCNIYVKIKLIYTWFDSLTRIYSILFYIDVQSIFEVTIKRVGKRNLFFRGSSRVTLLPSVRFRYDFMGELCPECQASRRWRTGSYLQTRFRGAHCGLRFRNCYFRGSSNPDGRDAYKPPEEDSAQWRPWNLLLPDDARVYKKIHDAVKRGEEGKAGYRMELATEKAISCMNWLGAGGRPSCLHVGSPPPIISPPRSAVLFFFSVARDIVILLRQTARKNNPVNVPCYLKSATSFFAQQIARYLSIQFWFDLQISDHVARIGDCIFPRCKILHR